MNLGLVQTRPAGGAGVSDHSLLSNLGYAAAAHTGFCSLGTAQIITAEKLIDQAVALRFGHAAGPTIQGQPAGNILTIASDLQLNDLAGGYAGHAAIAPAVPDANTQLVLGGSYGAIGGTHKALAISPLKSVAAGAGSLQALYGQATLTIDAGATGSLQGLNFLAMAGGAGTATEIEAVWGRIASATFSTVTITKAATFYARSPIWYGAKPALAVGLYVEPHGAAGVTNAVGALIDAPAGATNNYTIWAGAPITGTPRLRLDAGTPAAGQTMLYLAEGVAPTVRRVQWMDPGAGGGNFVGGERVMILV